MDDRIHRISAEYRRHHVHIRNVTLFKHIPIRTLVSFYIRQVFPMTGIGQFIQVNHPSGESRRTQQLADKMGTDETTPTGHQNIMKGYLQNASSVRQNTVPGFPASEKTQNPVSGLRALY